MNAADLLAKADRAIASARLLLDAVDLDGACNRAYYAMFDAARAALASFDDQVLFSVRSHSGLIALFSERLVKTGHLSIEHGRALNKVEELRRIADYRGDMLDPALVRQAIEQAAAFVAAVHQLPSADAD